jgi:pimeloyl-ACP methyl ester carboxylesterase
LGGWVALLTAAQRAERVRALILGDPPLNLERFVADESGEDRVGMWRGLRGLAQARLSVADLAAALPRSPGTDDARHRSWAKSLSQVDPDVILYHAEGRIDEYVHNIDLDAALRQATCPVLLIQADPACGGRVLDGERDHALSLLDDGAYVQLAGTGHDLGLGTWEAGPLIRSVVSFLESL